MNTFIKKQFPISRNLKFRGCIGCFFSASLISALLLSAVAAQANTITVTSGNDSGAGTLRQAILDASPSGGDTINFAAGITTINLTSGELLIDKNLTINGPGANLLTVQRSSAFDFRIFDIASTTITATISGLTIANGRAFTNTNGSGISNVGTLTIINCTISGGHPNGSLGAGIYNAGLMTITVSTISGNVIDNAGSGGGIFNGGRITITNSTISGNSALSDGGINNAGGGIMTVTASTVSGNVCGGGSFGGGGGIGNGGTLTVTASTISGNVSGGGSFGGGGGILNDGTLTVRNTIISLNTDATMVCPDVCGALTSQNFNLIGNNAGATITPAQPADQIGTPGSPIDPLLGPLQNNGGPTQTQALLSGSRAIDKGNSSGLSTDQRGFPRPVDLPNIPNAIGGDGSDIGAFELGAAAGGARAAVADFNGDGHPDYVVQQAGTHQTGIWYLSNNFLIGTAYAPTLPGGWGLRGVGDFNRDAHPDYGLFNPGNAQTAIWYLSGPTFIGSAYGPNLPGGWELVATADFNGDNYPDYVLYNAGTHQTAIWYLNNSVLIGTAYGPTLPTGWSVAGVADFDRDGHPDYALFNSGTGQTAIWYLSGPTLVGGAFGPGVPSGWQLVAVADFNGDGYPDYVLYNAASLQTAIWYLNNNVLIGTAYGPTLPAGWSLVAP